MSFPSDKMSRYSLVMSCLASNTEDGNTAVHLRNYEQHGAKSAYRNWPIWEAARATSAAPVYFERLTRKGDSGETLEFIDGGLGWNNPTFE